MKNSGSNLLNIITRSFCILHHQSSIINHQSSIIILKTKPLHGIVAFLSDLPDHVSVSSRIITDSYALTSAKQTNQSTALLSCSHDSSSTSNPSQKPFTKILFTAFLLFSCIALSAAAAFAFLFSSSSPASSSAQFSIKTTARPHKKLNKPVVILVSSDGFRFGYRCRISINPRINT